MNSRTVQRIDDVTYLRRFQFAEDAGPLAHPIRPDNYIEINNFYTVTIYEKGAEIIRMLRTIIGPENYRKGTDLYFTRHDGQAVTCDEFVQCMQDASDIDLTHFKLWYSQAGTPTVTVDMIHENDTVTLKLTQSTPDTPGQIDKKPMHIPISVSLLDDKGKSLIKPQTLNLTEAIQTFSFENIPVRPTPSLLRDFSAPVKLRTNLTDTDLAFLMVYDTDKFNRWNAGQKLALRTLNNQTDEKQFLTAYGEIIEAASQTDAITPFSLDY